MSGFRGGGHLLPAAMLGAVALAALAGCVALVGSFGGAGAAGGAGGAGPLHRGALGQVPLPSGAGMSGAPAVMPGGSPPGTGAQPTVPALGARDVTLRATPLPVATATPAARPSPGATGGQPAIVVRYTVDARQDGGFQAEVDIANNGSAPVSGWQLVVALPGDQITSFSNASGYVSNHILLLGPASSAPSIAPGASLRVSFAAQGYRTRPELCAFNGIACG